MTCKRHPRAAWLALALAIGGSVAQATELTHAQACALIAADAERLKCYDVALKRDRLLTAHPEPRVPEQASDVHAEFPPPRPSRWPALFVRASTSLSAENKDPAEFALVRSEGESAGAAKAAVLWVQQATLDPFDLSKKGATGYVGVGFVRDKTTPNKPISTQNIRGGVWRVWNPHDDTKREDSSLAADFGFQVQSDDSADTRTASFEVDLDARHRWRQAGRFGRVLSEYNVRAGLTPWIDRVIHDPAKGSGSARGLELRIGASSSISQFLDIGRATPDSVDWLSTRVREFSGRERVSTLHTLSANWTLREANGSKQGLKLERSVGNNFREGEPKAAKTSLKLTLSYGR